MDAGDLGHIYVDGAERAPQGRGYNLVALDAGGGAVLAAGTFDTHADPGASAALADGSLALFATASQAEVLKEQIAKFVLRDEEADGLKYSGMSPDEIKRLEKLFEKSHIVADAPPKPIHETEEKKASSKY